MTRCLSALRLKNLTDVVTSYYGLRAVPAERIEKLYTEEVSQPLLLTGAEAEVWVDRWYLALREKGRGIRYLYVTSRHIAEEKEGVRRAKDKGFALPADVAGEFARTEREAAQRGIALDGRLLSKLCGGESGGSAVSKRQPSRGRKYPPSRPAAFAGKSAVG